MLQRERSGSWKLRPTCASHQAARHQTWVCQDGTGLAGFCDAPISRATRWESKHGDSCVFCAQGLRVQEVEDVIADSSSVAEQDATQRLVTAVKGPLTAYVHRKVPAQIFAVGWCTTIGSFSFGLTSRFALGVLTLGWREWLFTAHQ